MKLNHYRNIFNIDRKGKNIFLSSLMKENSTCNMYSMLLHSVKKTKTSNEKYDELLKSPGLVF